MTVHGPWQYSDVSVISPFVTNEPTRDLLVDLHKAAFSNCGWHISIICRMLVNMKYHCFRPSLKHYFPINKWLFPLPTLAENASLIFEVILLVLLSIKMRYSIIVPTATCSEC